MSLNWEPIVDACPACESSQIRFAFEMRYWREHVLRFHDCENCGSSFSNPMPSVDLITRGNNALVSLYRQGREFGHEMRDARQAYLRGRVLAGKLRRIKKHGKLLEIGCYDGFMLLGIQEHCDWTVEGVEIAEAPAKFAQTKLGLRIHQGTLEDLKLQEAQYDFVLCHDLIEHINRPREFLKQLARVLALDGRLQIITPNAKQDLAFARRAFQTGKSLNMLLNHVIYFSPKGLDLALQSVGLKSESLYCYDIRHSLKDFGFFGLGAPRDIPDGLAISDVKPSAGAELRELWNDQRLQELRAHPKVGWGYAMIKEVIPGWFKARMPASLEIGHEIFARAIKL